MNWNIQNSIKMAHDVLPANYWWAIDLYQNNKADIIKRLDPTTGRIIIDIGKENQTFQQIFNMHMIAHKLYSATLSDSTPENNIKSLENAINGFLKLVHFATEEDGKIQSKLIMEDIIEHYETKPNYKLVVSANIMDMLFMWNCLGFAHCYQNMSGQEMPPLKFVVSPYTLVSYVYSYEIIPKLNNWKNKIPLKTCVLPVHCLINKTALLEQGYGYIQSKAKNKILDVIKTMIGKVCHTSDTHNIDYKNNLIYTVYNHKQYPVLQDNKCPPYIMDPSITVFSNKIECMKFEEFMRK